MERIGRCCSAIREWEQYAEDNSGAVAPDSRLAADDALNRSFPASTAAWSSIAVAIDHLGLADDSLSREGGARLHPFAFQAVCRSALVAASQALWVLTGGRDTRLRRLQLLQIEDTEKALGFLQDYSRDETLVDDVSAEFTAALSERVSSYTAELKRLKKEVRPQQREYNVTKTLRDAAKYIATQRPGDPWLLRAYVSEWRMASASAHARLWQSEILPHEDIPLVGTGQRLRLTTGTPQSYGMSLSAAVMATDEALKLWHTHSSSPTTN